MAFSIQDTPTGVGSDNMEVAVLPDDVFLTYGCNFATNQAAFDDTFDGSGSDSGNVGPDNYDLVVVCNNVVDPCLFNLTWSARY